MDVRPLPPVRQPHPGHIARIVPLPLQTPPQRVDTGRLLARRTQLHRRPRTRRINTSNHTAPGRVLEPPHRPVRIPPRHQPARLVVTEPGLRPARVNSTNNPTRPITDQTSHIPHGVHDRHQIPVPVITEPDPHPCRVHHLHQQIPVPHQPSHPAAGVPHRRRIPVPARIPVRRDRKPRPASPAGAAATSGAGAATTAGAPVTDAGTIGPAGVGDGDPHDPVQAVPFVVGAGPGRLQTRDEPAPPVMPENSHRPVAARHQGPVAPPVPADALPVPVRVHHPHKTAPLVVDPGVRPAPVPISHLRHTARQVRVVRGTAEPGPLRHHLPPPVVGVDRLDHTIRIHHPGDEAGLVPPVPAGPARGSGLHQPARRVVRVAHPPPIRRGQGRDPGALRVPLDGDGPAPLVRQARQPAVVPPVAHPGARAPGHRHGPARTIEHPPATRIVRHHEPTSSGSRSSSGGHGGGGGDSADRIAGSAGTDTGFAGRAAVTSGAGLAGGVVGGGDGLASGGSAAVASSAVGAGVVEPVGVVVGPVPAVAESREQDVAAGGLDPGCAVVVEE
ncbi:hypothetical protein PRAC110570_13170 [Propionibacterium acidifaciens]